MQVEPQAAVRLPVEAPGPMLSRSASRPPAELQRALFVATTAARDAVIAALHQHSLVLAYTWEKVCP